MIAETPEGTHAAYCDRCGVILDPGAADAPMGGYQTEAEAINAALSHGWLIDSTPLNAEARGRRAVLVGHAKWLRDESLPLRKDDYTRNRVAAELAAIRWALRIIDTYPELVNRVVHRPTENEMYPEEDR